MKQQFTLMIALELTDDHEWDCVLSRVDMIRSQTYDLMFRLITCRTQEPLVPSTGILNRKLLDIASKAVVQNKSPP